MISRRPPSHRGVLRWEGHVVERIPDRGFSHLKYMHDVVGVLQEDVDRAEIIRRLVRETKELKQKIILYITLLGLLFGAAVVTAIFSTN